MSPGMHHGVLVENTLESKETYKVFSLFKSSIALGICPEKAVFITTRLSKKSIFRISFLHNTIQVKIVSCVESGIN